MEEKQIAKEILIALIQNSAISAAQYPEAKTAAEAVGLAYQEILSAVTKS